MPFSLKFIEKSSFHQLSKPTVSEQDVEHVQNSLAAVKIQDSELGKLQEKQRAAVQRSIGRGKDRVSREDEEDSRGRSVHPDLQDLSFGTLGNEQRYGTSISSHFEDYMDS